MFESLKRAVDQWAEDLDRAHPAAAEKRKWVQATAEDLKPRTVSLTGADLMVLLQAIEAWESEGYFSLDELPFSADAATVDKIYERLKATLEETK